MDILAVKKYKWEIGGEWMEKWYATELCFLAFYKNPLSETFLPQGLNSISLNTIWYYEIQKSDEWEILQKAVVKKKLSFYQDIIQREEKYIQEIEGVLKKIQDIKDIDLEVLYLIKQGLLSIWYLFLADIGKYLDETVTRLLDGEPLLPEEKEEVKQYFLSIHQPLGYQLELQDLNHIYQQIKQHYHKIPDTSFTGLTDKLKEAITVHKKLFDWNFTTDIDTSPPLLDDYWHRIQELKDQQILSGQVKDIEKTVKAKISANTLLLLTSFNKLLFIDNYVADLYQRIDFLLQNTLSRQFEIPFHELSWYTWDELESLVRDGLPVSQKDIEVRKLYRVMIQIDGKIKIFYGQDDYKQMQSLLSLTPLPFSNTFSGTKASI